MAPCFRGEQLVTRFYESQNAAIAIAVVPFLMESKGSKSKGMWGAIFGVNTNKSLGFRHDFYDMELTRDGVHVEPLRRKRTPMNVFYLLPGWVDAKDSARAGVYSYDPAAFRPGAKLELKVKREYNTEDWLNVKISESLQADLYNQFSGYYAHASKQSAAK